MVLTNTQKISEHQGRIRVDVTFVNVERGRLKNMPIDQVKDVKRATKSMLLDMGITLEARLRFNLEKPISPQIKYKIVEIPGESQRSFTFLYREKGENDESTYTSM